MGRNALLANTTGTSNIALGINAGFNLTTGNNNIAIGHAGVAAEANTTHLGTSQSRTFIAGINGVTVGASAMVLINASGQLGTVVSSGRYKQDIQPMGTQSQQLLDLRPVTFHYTADPQGTTQYGLIAEEVAKVYPELVTTGTDGQIESVQYHQLIPMLLNELQRQAQRVEGQAQELATLKAQNASLRAALQEQNAAFAARLARLEEAAGHTATLAHR